MWSASICTKRLWQFINLMSIFDRVYMPGGLMLHEKEASDSLLNHAECSSLLPPCMKTIKRQWACNASILGVLCCCVSCTLTLVFLPWLYLTSWTVSRCVITVIFHLKGRSSASLICRYMLWMYEYYHLSPVFHEASYIIFMSMQLLKVVILAFSLQNYYVGN